MSKTILIIDADVIVYKYAAPLDIRGINVKHIKSGREKSFKTRTEFKAFLSDKKYDYVESDYIITDTQVAVDGAEVRFRNGVNKIISSMKDAVWADQTEIYISAGGDNHRHNLALPVRYKHTRQKLLKPLLFSYAKEYMIKSLGAIPVEGIETDDMVTIRAYEELAKGNDPVISTIDKDADQSQDIRILNWQNEPWRLERIPSVGNLTKDEKGKVNGTGLKFLAYQALAGDPTDVYKPYELSTIPIRYGPSSVYEGLVDKKTESDILKHVVSEYKKLYPTEFTYKSHTGNSETANWEDMLLMYWKCAYMLRSKDDDGNFWTFAKQYGVTNED